jgi:hypothetical protein
MENEAMLHAELVALLIAASPALAASHHPEVHEAKLPDCYCRAEGRIVAEGETACMATSDGPRLAECGMSLNVMSWIVTDRPCPVT